MNTSPHASNATWHLALAAFALAVSWWLPNHHWPWADFYSDAWAGMVLGLIASVVLWKSRGGGALEWHLLPLVALACAGAVGAQYKAGLIGTSGLAWINALYLLALAIALLTGAAWERLKSDQCAHFLFLAVLIGATGSLLIQLQQWLRIDAGDAFWLFLPAPAGRFHANIGQPNQLASLMCLGVLACAWLHAQRRLPGKVAWVLAGLLAVGLSLTESRTSWVVILCSLTTVLLLRKRIGVTRGFIASAFCWIVVFALCVFSLPYVNAWLGRPPQEVRGLTGGEMRLDIWAGVWHAIQQKPWFGYGWMQTSLTQFPADPYLVPTGGSLRHAHNLFLDLLVFLGIPLGLAVCAVLVMWFAGALRRLQTQKQLWMLLFVAALGIHAMFEFPLYYAYFLLPLGLMVGALNVALGFRVPLRTGRWPVFVMLGAALWGCVVTIRDYLPIEENFFSLRFEQQKLARPDENSLPSSMVLTHLQDLLWLGRVDPVKAHGEADIARATLVSKLTPSLTGQFKLAAMYALAEKPREAEYWLIVMLRSNGVKPRAAEVLRMQWLDLATLYPPMRQVVWPEHE